MKPTYSVSMALVAVVVMVIHNSATVVAKQSNFLAQIQFIDQGISNWYKRESKYATLKAIVLSPSDAYFQSRGFHWPRKMMRVLQLATGTNASGGLDSLKIHRVVAGLKNKDSETQEEFMGYYNEYSRKHSPQLVNELCAPYRPGPYEYFNFFGAINDLVKMKEDEKVDDNKFFSELFQTKVGMLYSAALVCQYLDSVTGKLSEDTMRATIDARPYLEYKKPAPTPIYAPVTLGESTKISDPFEYNIFLT